MTRSNHEGARSRILTESMTTLCPGQSLLMCRDTSLVLELGLLCSINLTFRFLSVSPIYYTVIDFNEVDISIYLPEKVNITLKGR